MTDLSFSWSRFATWPKGQSKNLNILRTKKTFEVKKACSITFKGFSLAKKLSQTWECAFKNFANFTAKQLCWSFFFNKVADWKAWDFIKKILQNRCFPVKFVKLLRIPFSAVHLRWLFLVHIMQRNISKDDQLKCKHKKWTAKILRLSESHIKSLVFINVSHDVVQVGQSSRILICTLLIVFSKD